jgi:hypothetical protein
MRALVAMLTLVIALAAGAAPAFASPAEEMDTARDAFRRSDWNSALPILSSLLYPTPRLASAEDIYEAHLLLGMCAFETNDRLTATREFEEAIALKLDRQLSTGVFSEASTALYEERRKAMEEKYKLEEEKRQLALEREKYRRMVEAMVIVEKRDYYVNFIPFGAGQYQNGQTTKGILFASAEGVTGAVSAGIWMYLVGTYGLSGTVSNDDANFVLRLEQIEIGAGAAFIGIAAWGIVDALVHYKPSIVRKPDESLLPPDMRPHTTPIAPPGGEKPRSTDEPKKPPGTTFNLLPTPLPGGAGFVLSWEF